MKLLIFGIFVKINLNYSLWNTLYIYVSYRDTKHNLQIQTQFLFLFFEGLLRTFYDEILWILYIVFFVGNKSDFWPRLVHTKPGKDGGG